MNIRGKKLYLIFLIGLNFLLLSCDKTKDSINNTVGELKVLMNDSNGYHKVNIELLINIEILGDSNPKEIIIDYGDGQIESLKDKNISHSYKTKGEYLIKVSAIYSNEVVNYTKKIIIVDNFKPEIEWAVTTTDLSLEINYKATDKDNDIQEVIVNYGNGETRAYKDVNATVKYDYFKSGTYNISITTIDKSGNQEKLTKELVIETNKIIMPGADYDIEEALLIESGKNYECYNSYSKGYYKFIAKESLCTLSFDNGQSKAKIISVLDSNNMTLLASSEILEGSSAKLTAFLEVGKIYYLKVEKKDYSDYEKYNFSLSFRDVQNIEESIVYRSSEKTENIYSEEFYRIKPSSNAITIRFNNLETTNTLANYKIKLLSSDRKKVLKEVSALYGDGAYLTLGIIPYEIYYIKIISEREKGGNYEIGYNSLDELWEIEDNNSPQTSNLIVENKIYKGYEFGGTDWFRFIAEGNAVNIKFQNLDKYDYRAKFKLRLISTDKSTIMKEVVLGNNVEENILAGVKKGQMYYLQIITEISEGGNYQLNFESLSELYEIEKNDTSLTANLIEKNKEYNGEAIGEYDWFKLVTDTNQITLQLEKLQTNNISLTLVRYDGKTTMIEKTLDSNNILELTAAVETNKAYYVKIYGGKYKLTYKQ